MDTPAGTDDRGAAGTAGTEEEVFEKAFNEAQGVKDKADQPAAEEPEKPEGDKVPPKEPPEEEGEKPKEETPVKTEPEGDDKSEQRYKTLQGIHRKDKEDFEAQKKQWTEKEAELNKQLEELKKGKTPDKPKDKEESTADEGLSDVTKEELEAYERDFDLVSKMEGVRLKKGLAELEKRFAGLIDTVKGELAAKLTELESKTKKVVAPAVKLAEDEASKEHFRIIAEGFLKEDGTAVEGHPDFRKYRAKEDGGDGSLLQWIEEGPAYLQDVRKKVYSKGTAEQLIELLSEFKRDKNITTEESPESEQPSERKAQKRMALKAVDTKSPAIGTGKGAPKEDFEGAFDEAMKKLGGT